MQLAVIVGSTRPGRKARAVADWVLSLAQSRGDAQYELVDLLDLELPLIDEPAPPARGEYQRSHTRRWAEIVARQDGFVFVTPEYNHATSGALKNAIDYLFAEWNDKAAAFVGYGGAGGARAIEQLRLVLGELKVADVRSAVTLTLREDFTDYTTFTPRDSQRAALGTALDELVAWAGALRTVRAT
jgi:NAD(P)H-dependent FMN reductase